MRISIRIHRIRTRPFQSSFRRAPIPSKSVLLPASTGRPARLKASHMNGLVGGIFFLQCRDDNAAQKIAMIGLKMAPIPPEGGIGGPLRPGPRSWLARAGGI
jgi:hypothetical protein